MESFVSWFTKTAGPYSFFIAFLINKSFIGKRKEQKPEGEWVHLFGGEGGQYDSRSRTFTHRF